MNLKFGLLASLDMPTELSLNFHNSEKGYIISPAGYGKTETIVDSVVQGDRKQLVLTHTHAGVQSLRKRFRKKQVSQALYHLDTLDSFTSGYLAKYPSPPFSVTESPTDQNYWEHVRLGFLALLEYPFFVKLLKILYSGFYVDEYQDTSRQQHQIVMKMAEILPCRVVGDPYQSVFDFDQNEIVSWETDVEGNFNLIGELKTPHRWTANPELGEWLKSARRQIFEAGNLDLTTAPRQFVSFHPAPSYQERTRVVTRIARQLSTSILITNWQSAQRHLLARNSGGIFSSMEEMECRDLRTFAHQIDLSQDNSEKARVVAQFVSNTMTGAGKQVQDNLERLLLGKIPRNNYFLQRIKFFEALQLIVQSGTFESITYALETAPTSLGSHIFRRELYYEALKTLRYAFANYLNLTDSAQAVRYKTRMLGRMKNQHEVSSVLLIKGLEYKNAIIVEPERMSLKELYVAITRPTESITIFTNSAIIHPRH